MNVWWFIILIIYVIGTVLTVIQTCLDMQLDTRRWDPADYIGTVIIIVLLPIATWYMSVVDQRTYARRRRDNARRELKNYWRTRRDEGDFIERVVADEMIEYLDQTIESTTITLIGRI